MPASTGARVLTVEDDPIVRADLSLILEDHGFDVCADARDGADIEAVIFQDQAQVGSDDRIVLDGQNPRSSAGWHLHPPCVQTKKALGGSRGPTKTYRAAVGGDACSHCTSGSG